MRNILSRTAPPVGFGVQTGPTYTYAYDGMGRPISLADNQTNPVTWVNIVTYGLSEELLTLNNETRQYNSRLQLINITVSGGTLNIDYRYSSNQNNGQITQQKDWISGEEVSYTYDSLQRLIGAVTTDPSWGQSFTYDGFGNRTSAAVTKGSAPYGNWSYDPSTNRAIGSSYDANGNLGAGSYDVENRLVSVPTAYNWDTRRTINESGRKGLMGPKSFILRHQRPAHWDLQSNVGSSQLSRCGYQYERVLRVAGDHVEGSVHVPGPARLEPPRRRVVFSRMARSSR
jgi:YD repeat-containing protein